jgi:hypothetical protein
MYGNAQYPHLEGIAEYWAEIANCNLIPIEIELPDIDPNDGSTVTLLDCEMCDNDLEVLCYRIEGGNHCWSGTYSCNMDINSTVELWKFFYRNPFPEISTNYNSIEIQLQFNVSPNPCLKNIKLQITCQNKEIVHCALNDISGVEINTFINNTEIPNFYEKTFDISDLKPGVYFITMRTNKGIGTKKLIKL